MHIEPSAYELIRDLERGQLELDDVLHLLRGAPAARPKGPTPLRPAELELVVGDDRLARVELGSARGEVLARALARTLDALVLREEVHAVLIFGGRDHFAVLAEGEALAALAALRRFPLPTIAAVEGHAIAGGLLIALGADFGVLAEHALYGVTALEREELPPPEALPALARSLTPTLALELLTTSRRYPGHELRSRGAGVEVLPVEGVRERALLLAREIARHPRDLLEGAKLQHLEQGRRR